MTDPTPTDPMLADPRPTDPRPTDPRPSVPTPAALLEIAETVAREAAELAARRRAEGVEVAETKSSAVDVVTYTDREVETFVRQRLAELRPGDGFFGEEGEPDGSTTGLTWVVDPIDGTVNFVYGIPQWAVSIAVIEGGPDPLTWRALAAVVANPASGETFTASVGGGAWLGGRRLAVSSPPSLEQTLLATGFSYDADRRVRHAEALVRVVGRVRDLRRFGAASLDLCAVAAGRVDAYVERGLKPWDHAAGVLVAAEAGAVVRGEVGQAPSESLTFVASPTISADLDDLVVESGL